MEILNLFTYVFIFVALYIQIFFLINYFELREKEKKGPSVVYHKDRERSVTAIVPILNEETTVLSTLDSLLALDYPDHLFKIIVVNDGSKDNSASVVQNYIATRALSDRIRFISKDNGGKFTALNLALEVVDTEFAGCLDADSYVQKDSLKKIMQKFYSDEVMAVTPSVKVHEPKGFLGNIQKAEYMFGAFLRRIFNHLGAIYVTPGPFSIFRVEVFKRIGGYKHAHLTEDCEIALRMQRNRMKIENAYDALIFTTTPKTVYKLYIQRLRWSYGFLRNALDYRDLFFNPKYGSLGLVVLPAALFSIVTTLYFFYTNVWNTFESVRDKVGEIATVGILHSSFSFDLFYFNTEIIVFVYLFSFAGTMFMIVNSRKFTKEKGLIGPDSFLFIFFYMFLAPFWMSRAVFNLIFQRTTKWR